MRLKTCIVTLLITIILLSFSTCVASAVQETATHDVPLSPQTQSCLACHITYTPGIVKDWQNSRHARMLPIEALKKSLLEKRISVKSLPDELGEYGVGCYECHSLNPAMHKDNFKHMGYKINVVVTPDDCKACHPMEANQYAVTKLANAHKNVMDNSFYRLLINTITGLKRIDKATIISDSPSDRTLHETCLGCHGTNVQRIGTKTIVTKFGNLEIPDLTNWPNQGVGRINPDGSQGACTSCHPRHGFSIELARKPYTCSQCHLEPDVPAWYVYKESKHGNIYSATFHKWNFESVPWIIGKDFKAPTCATCHSSLIVSPTGDVIVERTHDFGSRLWVRLFGLIYSHQQPRSGDTTKILNKDGLPLPTSLYGEPASEYLIDQSAGEKRLTTMKNICNSCHSSDWTNNHFLKLESTIRETNTMTRAATDIMAAVWEQGTEDRSNPFDEAIEQMWIKQWLFYSNSIRYASAMTGAPDYATFKNGWWYLSETLQRMKDWAECKEKLQGAKTQ